MGKVYRFWDLDLLNFSRRAKIGYFGILFRRINTGTLFGNNGF